jgi:hypothetical protein
MYNPLSKIVLLGLLVSAPLISAYAIPNKAAELDRRENVSEIKLRNGLVLTSIQIGSLWVRSVLPLNARHHTEAQIAVSDTTLSH